MSGMSRIICCTPLNYAHSCAVVLPVSRTAKLLAAFLVSVPLVLSGCHSTEPIEALVEREPKKVVVELPRFVPEVMSTEVMKEDPKEFTEKAPKPNEEVLEQLALVNDTELSLERRRTAAQVLLAINTEESINAFVSVLEPTSEVKSQLAAVQAILLNPQDPPFASYSSLLNLLGTTEGELQARTAEAIGRLPDSEQIISDLADAAMRADAPYLQRCGAIMTLGYQRSKKSASVLIKLIDLDQPRQIRKDAFAALMSLTSIDEFGEDYNQWANWWKFARKWKNEKWHTELIKASARRSTKRQLEKEQYDRYLVRVSRERYRAAEQGDRSDILIEMMNASPKPIRMLAMELVHNRLIDGLAFNDALRAALRKCLSDSVAEIRQKAAQQLDILADVQAAKIVSNRLSESQEGMDAVLLADLMLLKRIPQQDAVEPALLFMQQPALYEVSAEFLAAAADQNMLTDVQKHQAAESIRMHLQDMKHPLPSFIVLLGKVGNESDWNRIADWIDSEDKAVESAAASIWADSDRSLKCLADRAEDPIIQPIVIDAATTRGRDARTLWELIKYPPRDEQVHAAWERAVVTMSARVPAEAVLKAIKALPPQESEATDETNLPEQMLSSAISRNDASASITETEKLLLLLERAELRLARSNTVGAQSDYRLIDSSFGILDISLHDRFFRGYIRARLLDNAIDEAFVIAKRLFSESATKPLDADPIVRVFVGHANLYINGKRYSEARQILQKLRELLPEFLSPEVAASFSKIETLLEKESSSVKLPQTPPAAKDTAPASDQAPASASLDAQP